MRKQKWFDVLSSCKGFSRSCRSWKWWKLSELPPSLMLCLPASKTLLLITDSWTRLLSGVFCVHGFGKVFGAPDGYQIDTKSRSLNRIWRFIRVLEMFSNKKCEHLWKITCLGVVRGMLTRCFGKVVYFYLGIYLKLTGRIGNFWSKLRGIQIWSFKPMLQDFMTITARL